MGGGSLGLILGFWCFSALARRWLSVGKIFTSPLAEESFKLPPFPLRASGSSLSLLLRPYSLAGNLLQFSLGILVMLCRRLAKVEEIFIEVGVHKLDRWPWLALLLWLLPLLCTTDDDRVWRCDVLVGALVAGAFLLFINVRRLLHLSQRSDGALALRETATLERSLIHLPLAGVWLELKRSSVAERSREAELQQGRISRAIALTRPMRALRGRDA